MSLFKNTLSLICSKVRRVLETDLSNESADFKSGFRHAYNLFIIGLEKEKGIQSLNNSYNTTYLKRDLEREIEKRDKKIRNLQVEIVNLKNKQ